MMLGGHVIMKKYIIILLTLLLVGCQNKNVIVKKGVYVCNDKQIECKATLELFEENGKDSFKLYPSSISSMIYNGTYEVDNDRLVLHDKSQGNIYFHIDNQSLSFLEKESIKVEYLKNSSLFDLEVKE